MMIRLLLLLSVFLCCPNSIICQYSVEFDHLSKQDGLSSNSATCIFKDSRGYIWIGTKNGLNRFDAYEFEIWKHIPGDSTSISHNYITDITEDKNGYIWISTMEGLNRFNYKSNEIRHFLIGDSRHNFYLNKINDICFDHKNRIWNASSKGLFLLKKDLSGFTQIRFDTSLNKNTPLNTLEKNTKGNIFWIGSRLNGLFEYNIETKQSKRIFYKDNKLNTVSSLHLDTNNALFIGTNTDGVFVYNTKKKSVSAFKPEYHFQQHVLSDVWSIDGDIYNNIWISQSTMLYRYKGNTLQDICVYEEENKKSRSPGHIKKIYCDNTGITWLAIGMGGIDKYDKKQRLFSQYYVKGGSETDNKNYVKSIVIDNDKNLWAGTFGNGLKVFNRELELIHTYKIIRGIPKTNYINHLMIDKNDNMWISTLGGLIQYDYMRNGQKKLFTTKNNLWHIVINKTFEDSNGDIWIATQEGLNKYQPGSKSFIQYAPEDGLAHHKITDFLEVKAGNIWIATYDGISVYSPPENRFRNFYQTQHESAGLSNKTVNCITQDSRGNIWIGTDNGLNKYSFQTGEFKWSFEKDGLSCNIINNITEDDKNNLWMITCSGLSLFNEHKGSFSHYNEFDGLNINRHELQKHDTGYLILAGLKTGFYLFNPDSIPVNKYIPPVYITKISSSSNEFHPVFPGKEEVFDYNNRNIRIKFTALNYTSSENNQFAYMLDNFDSTWNYTSAANREAVYTNLNPGEYEFRVIASNNNNIWNKKGDRLHITILPPWWLSLEAYFFYLILICCLFIILKKIQTAKSRYISDIRLAREQIKVQEEKARLQKETNEQRFKFFTDISHEFRTPLTLISIPVEASLKVKSLPKVVFNKLLLAKRNIARLQTLITQLVDYRKITLQKLNTTCQPVELTDFIKSIYNVFAPYCEKKKIHYQFSASEESLICLTDVDLLDKIIYNLLSNAVKHTPDEGTIKIEIRRSKTNETGISGAIADDVPAGNNQLCISVSNTGKGIAPEHLNKIFDRFYQIPGQQQNSTTGSGIGLSLVKEYVTLLGGNIHVTSEPGGLTIFSFVLPIKVSTEESDDDSIKRQTGFAGFEEDNQPNGEHDIDIQEETQMVDERKMLLIVEDNKDLGHELCQLFAHDYQTLYAENGDQGFELAIKNVPDLIISDIIMPVMDGYELCEKCKTHEISSHIPIILLTARADVESRINGIDKGADAYLNKPFEIKVLKSLVANLLQNREKLRQKFSNDNNALINNVSSSSSDIAFISKLNKILDTNISSESLTVDHVAKELGMSLRQFHRKCKGITNSAPGDYIRTYKLNKAAHILSGDPDISISEIAYFLGYKRVSHFSVAFKKQFGTSPSDFQENK